MASHPEYAHLPQGREPGWQTENASREARRGLGVVMMILLGLGMIAAGIYFAVEPANEDYAPATAILFFGGIGSGLIAWGLILHKRGMPKPPPFSVEVEDTELRRGDSSRARVECLAPARVKRPVTVGVVCREFYTVLVKQHMGTGSSSSDIDVEEAREVEVATTTQSLSPGDGPVTVEFTIPEDAPYSYEGRYVSLAWSVVVEEENTFRRKRAIGPFWVLP